MPSTTLTVSAFGCLMTSATTVSLPFFAGDAPADRGALLDVGDVVQEDRHAARSAHDRVLDVLDRVEAADPAHGVLRRAGADESAGGVLVAALDGLFNSASVMPYALRLVRVDRDPILAHVAAHVQHLGDARHGKQVVAICHSASLAQLRQREIALDGDS